MPLTHACTSFYIILATPLCSNYISGTGDVVARASDYVQRFSYYELVKVAKQETIITTTNSRDECYRIEIQTSSTSAIG